MGRTTCPSHASASVQLLQGEPMNPAIKAIAGSLALLMTMAAWPVHSQEVIPDFYKDPGIQPNRSYVNQGFG